MQPSDPIPISIGGEAIPLGAFLKLAGAAATGGGGKRIVQSGGVRVNGAVETRRGHKLVPGDVVEIAGAARFLVAR
jgi:ribosome-associated protein